MKKNLISRIESTVQKYGLFKRGEKLLVACSGGADSVALFYLLRELARPLRLRLTLVHFDHALRKTSARDLQFVRRLARKTKVPFYSKRGQPPRLNCSVGSGQARRFVMLGQVPLRGQAPERCLSPEERARYERYRFFAEAVRKTGVRKIVLGHHRDDQAETVLMRIVQGTGLRGLQGIRPVMPLKKMTLVRPLIEIPRSDLRKFLKKNSIPFRNDPTNRSERFLRNRIRHRLLPLLEKEFNPQIRSLLCRLGETARRESAGLDRWAEKEGMEFIRSRRDGALTLKRCPLLALPSPLQFRLLDQFARLLHPKSGIDYEAWERIERGFQKGKVRVNLPRNLDLNLTSKKLTLSR